MGVRCFADADWGGILGERVPRNVWLTDTKDMEGYLLCTECIEKVLRLVVQREDIDAGAMLAEALSVARVTSVLRLVSIREQLNLPFSTSKLHRHLTVTSSKAALDLKKFVLTLLNNSDRTAGECDGVLDKHGQLCEEYRGVDDLQITHGKDAIVVIGELLAQYRVPRAEVTNLMWISFERALADRWANLSTVVTYLST